MKPDVEVAIIGAGFAGLGVAIRLKQAGRSSFVVFERATEVGGTWRDNTYPGCACDVPSHLYSFSFAPNPNWTQTYSPQPEILDYLKRCVETYNLRAQIRFGSDIIRTEFQEDSGCWTLTDRSGQTLSARVVVVAIGPLNRPSVPVLNGLDRFAGRSFHSSAWDHGCPLNGKRVAVIGTGASAIQIVPEVAKTAGYLSVFQRTPPYITPRRNRRVSTTEQRLYRRLPLLQRLRRHGIFWANELFGLSFTGNTFLRSIGTWVALNHLKNQVPDAELRQKLTPAYELGCKRVLVSDDYYPALLRPNVELVTDRIQEITPTGIITQDGREHPADVLIFSTGFVAADILCDLNILGRGGRNLFEDWKTTGAEAYKGISAAGYPNLLFLVGPNTGLGHNSIVHIIESQVNYVLDYLKLLDKAGSSAFLDVRPEVQRAYNERIQHQLAGTVWATGCQSWYLNAQGKNTTLWPRLNVHYRKETERVRGNDYVMNNE